MEEQIEIWYSEYELRQFIDMAIRWKIEGVYNSRTEQRPFSIFTYKVEHARENFEKFSTQLNKKLSKNENWKAIGIDLKSRFLVSINQYISWYNQNEKELIKFQPYCPYSLMLNVIESTKAEILKYFPELEKEVLPPQPIKTKAEILKEQLSEYSFFELEKVKTLSEQCQFSLIEMISENGLPYAIAMFDYLQFIQYLEKQHFNSKSKLQREISKWFNSDKEGRAVKGNISSLLKYTTENKHRYTAHKHKENVIKDYNQLK